MAKKKKKKKDQPLGLRDMYEVGDELVVTATIKSTEVDEETGEEVETEDLTKTPVRVVTVGYNCIGVKIIGNWGRKFVKGFEFHIEEIPFRVINESKTSAVIECLDEDIYTD